MKRDISFSDVLLDPKFNKIASRGDVSLATNVAGLRLNLPIISSNMDSVTEIDMAAAMAVNGGIGALHRFCDIDKNVAMFEESIDKTVNNSLYKGNPKPIVSIGVNGAEFERAVALIEAGATHILIDVAHGASQNVVDQYDRLRVNFGRNISIIVGNFANAKSIEDWLHHSSSSIKPDAFKIGIGGGSNCSTRVVSGCGRSTLSSIIDCAPLGFDLIADGGITNSGDIVKALYAGASAVMLGSLLAGTDEAPGEITEFQEVYTDQISLPRDGKYPQDSTRLTKLVPKFKTYRGSASLESYAAQNKTAGHRAPEGVSREVPYKGPVKDVLQILEGGIRSGFTYCGASNLKELRENGEFVEVSHAAQVEGTPHGKRNDL